MLDHEFENVMNRLLTFPWIMNRFILFHELSNISYFSMNFQSFHDFPWTTNRFVFIHFHESFPCFSINLKSPKQQQQYKQNNFQSLWSAASLSRSKTKMDLLFDNKSFGLVKSIGVILRTIWWSAEWSATPGCTPDSKFLVRNTLENCHKDFN